jgi:hypothetical protein
MRYMFLPKAVKSVNYSKFLDNYSLPEWDFRNDEARTSNWCEAEDVTVGMAD